MDPAAHNANHEGEGGAGTGSFVGFGLGTPTDGPAQAPAYTNFSPLFSSANMTGLPPVAPIALRASTAANSTVPSFDPPPSFFPSFLDGSNGQNGNGFLMDQHAPPNSFAAWAAPVPIPCKPLGGMKRRRLDDFGSGMMNFAGDQPVDPSVEYGGPAHLDAYPAGGFPVAFDMPHVASESIPYYAPATAAYPAQQKPPPPITPQTSYEQARQKQQQEAPLTPESAVDAVLKKASGSSCHQCKNRRESRNLNFCRNRTRGTSDDKKKKICRKKFCDHCIIKFNYQARLPPKNSRDWECPSCLGICVCAACRRKNEPQLPAAQVAALATAAEVAAPVSPTLSFAHKLFYNPDLMVQGPDIQGRLPEAMPFFNSAF